MPPMMTAAKARSKGHEVMSGTTLETSAPPATPEHWTARFSRPIIFVIVAMVVIGVYLAFTIPVAVFPSTDFPRIVVGVDSGVAPIDQMEVTVTRPIEEALNSVPGLESVRSITSRGSADINLFFNWGVDMFQTLQYVNAAVARTQSTLPATAKITTNRLTFAAFPIIGYSLTSDTIPQTSLWELANYTIKPRLNRVNGVSMVVVQGGQVPEFQIEPDPAKLLQAQVSVPAILDAVSKSNLIDSPGLLENNHELSLALVTGQTRTPEEISNIVVKTTPAGIPIRVGDIANVTPSVMPVYTIVTANGKPAVLLNLFRQPDSNTAAVADAVNAELQQIRKTLPSGVRLESFYDQSTLVRDSIASVRDAILVGLILAAIILVLFLRDWGSSLVAGLVIPATIAITLIFLRTLGESFNLMTLGGLAAAVGLVIDDAIVVVENIVLHRDSGQTRAEAIRSALREIRIPLVGSTITPIVVFLPLITITGVTGTFFRALAITVGTALLTSLALALTWTPTLSHYLLRKKPSEGSTATDLHGQDATTGLMGRLTNLYGRALRATLSYPVLLILASVALIAGSYFCYNALGSDLLPEMDEGGFILDYLMPAGSSLGDTNQVLLGVEKILKSTPEVEGTSRRTGLQLGLFAVTEANTGDFSVKLKRDRDRGVDEVISEVRKKVNDEYPQLDVEFIQLLQDMIGDLTSSPEPIEIKLFSQNPGLLREWAPKVGDAIKKISAVKDVKNGIENTISGPAIMMRVDPVVAARAGFTPQEVELDASAILQGEPAPPPAVVNDRSYTIRVRFPDNTRTSLEQIRNTLITSNATGKVATLGSLAVFENQAGQTEVRRENLQRVVAVTGRFEGVSLGKGIEAVQQAVARLNIPASIRVVYGGTYAEQQKSFRDLLFVLMLAVILVFTVLLFEFGGFAAPVAILASALLSTSGVFLALLITGKTFNISSFMGLIMVIGIVAKNGILLLDADQRSRAEGASARDAMIEAGERRLRPIIMTALATVAGMIPLSLALGAGSQMLQPLAIAVIGGILASMVLSLIVTPAVHYYLSPREEASA
jgi:CzcA family heavy metal efflux pump